MKARNKLYSIFGIVFVVALVLSGCDVMGPVMTTEPGMGNVTVSFSAGRAALSPAGMDFDNYQFIFYKNGQFVEESIKEKNDSFTFSLETGSGYTLEVKAYKGSAIEENLAALGVSDTFTVNASVEVTVQLNGFLAEGPKGRFSYYIEYPQDAVIEELTLRINRDNNWNLLTMLSDSPSGGVVSDTVELSPGKYFFILRFSMNDESEIAGYANGVEIMAGHTTYYGTAGAPVVFTVGDFDSVPVLPYSRVDNWRGFDVKGMSHYHNNDRATNGRTGIFWDANTWDLELDGSYDPSRAVGFEYSTFTDANGKTWENVLKIVPPAENNPYYYRVFNSGYNGYQEYTITLSYPIPEAGKYKLSMWYQLEDGVESPIIYWQNTGGVHGNGSQTWISFAGSNTDARPRGTPLYLEGEIILRANEEIGMLARTLGNHGGLRDASIYVLDISVEKITPSEPPVVNIETVTAWEDFEVAFDIPGAPGKHDSHGPGYFYGSNAEYGFVDYKGYKDVLKLTPDKPVLFDGEGRQEVGMAMLYNVPLSGTYTFTMDVWIDPTSKAMPFFWYGYHGDYTHIIKTDAPLITGAWVKYSGSIDLLQGELTGFYTHFYGDSTRSFMDTSIYFRSFKLELAGNENLIVDISCPSAPFEPGEPEEYIKTWEEFAAVFDIPGEAGKYENAPYGYFYGSEADYSFVDYEGYANVLKLEPNKPVPFVAGKQDVGMAMLYNVPETGVYTFTMSVWVDPTASAMPFVWHGCTGYYQLRPDYYRIIDAPLVTGEWKTYSGTFALAEGDLTGFYTHMYDIANNLMDTAVYFRSFRVECNNVPIVDIVCQPSSSAAYGITLEWNESGVLIEADAVVISKGETVTITAPAGLSLYQWRVGRETYTGIEATHRSFVFDSANRAVGPYTVGFYSGADVGGDAVKITVIN